MIFKTTIDNDGNFKYYILPAHQKDEYTYLLKDNDKKRVIKDVISYSPNNININDNGEIIKE